jgi:hypothetical protein
MGERGEVAGRLGRRLTAEQRAEMETRRERLQVELRLLEAELRSDEALRLQERERPAEQPRLRGQWREWVR